MKKTYQAVNADYAFKNDGLKPSAILEVVATMLTNGWCQGSSAQNAEGEEVSIVEGVRFDMYGAFQRVKMMVEHEDDRHNVEVTFRIFKHVTEDYTWYRYNRKCTLGDFNDMEGVTQKFIVEYVNDVAKKMKGYNL